MVPTGRIGRPNSLPWVGWYPNRYAITGASQNTGMDMPRMAMARPATSPNDRGRRPPYAPTGMAMASQITAAPSTRDAVARRAGHRICDTGRCWT